MRFKIQSIGQKITVMFLTLGVISSMGICAPKVQAAAVSIGGLSSSSEDGNILLFNSGQNQVMVELCTDRTARVQLSANGDKGYRPYDPEYYMVQKNNWAPVTRTVADMDTYISVKTSAMEIRVEKNPIRIGMYDLSGRLLSRDTAAAGMYRNGNTVGVRKEEGAQNAGGIFGFGSGDHGRRSSLNRYNQDFSEFSMSHGRVVAPFFMSSVGYGIFLNTIEKNTVFYQRGGGFQTEGYLDYFFMYGPDFKTILNEYAEITGRMEMYGKWAHGFMLSKYGNDNATQAEFSAWINRLRDEGYPTDSYVFDYGWRGDVADNGGNQTGAGQKWGKQMWSNDFAKFPDIDAMFQEARELGFRVGLHNNAGTPEASGGKQLHIPEIEAQWVKSYMDSVITTGYGDWFWPDEFDVLGSNTAPTFSSKGAYEAWKDYTVESRPMFMTRGSYAGQHFATAWSGDINNTSAELSNQIGFSIDAGLIGYWASSHDLGGFMGKPSNALYTRWVSEFGAWNGIMRTHGHDGREPWLYDATAQKVLKENLKIRYALYPYIYTMAWQGYSQGVPMMRAMLLEDGSQYNPDAWNLNQQYYFGDWFLVAPAADDGDTAVSVWLPPNTAWYHYYTGELYEGGPDGKTIRIAAALEEIPVFVKAGAIVPMGPDVDYADELPLDPLTLDIYPSGVSAYTLYEDDGLSRRYITEKAYSTTGFQCVEKGGEISFHIGARTDYNPSVYQPDPRSYNLRFNHLEVVRGVKLNGSNLTRAASLSAYDDAKEAYWLDDAKHILYVKVKDTGKAMDIVLDTDGIVQPERGDENQGLPPQRIQDGDLFELENADFQPAPGGQVQADDEWKGYTGTGFVKGFKAAGDALSFQVNVLRGGAYNLVIRVNNGKQNAPQYDNSPRTGGLYLDGDKAAGLSFAVTDKWGDGNKNGEWRSYTVEGVQLEAGVHTFRIVSEGENPGNFNLDSLRFIRLDTSVDAFRTIEAESAKTLHEMTAGTEGGLSFLHTTADGAWAKYSDVAGVNKGGMKIRVKSATGGSVIVYENGVGDKILSTIELPADGQWTTLQAGGKDTDAAESDIFLEFRAKEGQSLDVFVDWFTFIRRIDAYSQVEAITASERQGVDIHNSGNYLNHIENGDWVRFDDIDFGDAGAATAMIHVAAGLQGGLAELYADNMEENAKIGEIEIKSTGSWSAFATYMADCAHITGIHRIYVKFVSPAAASICDFAWFRFSTDSITVQPEVRGGTAAVQISNQTAKPGDTVTFQIAELLPGSAVKSVRAEDAKSKEIPLKQLAERLRYSFTLPADTPVKIIVELQEEHPEIRSGTIIELEEGEGVTNNGNTALRVDKDWPGYSGTGYVAGWKTPGNYVQFKALVVESGSYQLTLRGAAGPKDESQYNASPRQGALYIDHVRIADFSLAVQENWGVWVEHVFERLRLDEGIHTFKFVSEGNVNPGNFNLDCVSFAAVADKDELRATLAEAKNANRTDKTAESLKVLDEAIEAAEKLLEDGNATDEQTARAIQRLRAALAGLEDTLNVLPGDLDKDGRVTIQDVMEACKILARKSSGKNPTADELLRGNLDGDPDFTINDVMEICKILARQA
ncbi:MAG: carbohydrate-binding protein [Clostridiales bacterium]|nr:carbohydrate-binding protein [Clostridiales bacterium]